GSSETLAGEVSGGAVARRMRDAGLCEAPATQHARVAAAARRAVRRRVVAGERERGVHAEGGALGDDLGLAQVDERRVDLQLLAPLRAGLRREVGHPLVGADVFGTAVGI